MTGSSNSDEVNCYIKAQVALVRLHNLDEIPVKYIPPIN